MSAIHDAILDHIEAELQAALIDNIDEADLARAGVVQQGPLQGSPAPDTARISVTVHENDPDRFYSTKTSAMTSSWDDEVLIVETSNVATWSRKFTVKARCLLSRTKEDLAAARGIASTLRSRIERAILALEFSSIVADDGEAVSRRAISLSMASEMVQAGGPGSYDYHIKVRFDLLTTTAKE